MIDATWTLLGNNQTPPQMRHNECWPLFLISFNILRTEGSTTSATCYINHELFWWEEITLFLLFIKWSWKKKSHVFIKKSCWSVPTHFIHFLFFLCNLKKNNFVITLRCALRVEEIKLFSHFHDFSLSYWDSLHEKLNNHYQIWSCKETMKKKKSF